MRLFLTIKSNPIDSRLPGIVLMTTSATLTLLLGQVPFVIQHTCFTFITIKDLEHVARPFYSRKTIQFEQQNRLQPAST